MGAREGGSAAIMQRVAIIGVAISIAVMVVAVCVIAGFRGEITSKVEAFVAHYEVIAQDNRSGYDGSGISKNEPFISPLLESGFVESVTPYCAKAGVMSHEEDIQGVLLKGVDSLYDMRFFAKYLVDGSLPQLSGEREKEILISSIVARDMGVEVGDKLRMMFMDSPIRRDIFTISGIYDTSLAEFDRTTAIVDMRNIQRLNDWDEDTVTGLEILTNSFNTSQNYILDIEDIVYGYESDERPVFVEDMRQKYAAIFEWLSLQDINIVVISVIMLVVAIFNMVAMMLILLIERTSTIGILKSVGITNGSLQRIFLYRAVPIIIKGLLAANMVSLPLCYLQLKFGLLKLNETGYFLTTVPIEFDWQAIIAINIISVIVIAIAQIVPTLVISKISPHKAIKYE